VRGPKEETNAHLVVAFGSTHSDHYNSGAPRAPLAPASLRALGLELGRALRFEGGGGQEAFPRALRKGVNRKAASAAAGRRARSAKASGTDQVRQFSSDDILELCDVRRPPSPLPWNGSVRRAHPPWRAPAPVRSRLPVVSLQALGLAAVEANSDADQPDGIAVLIRLRSRDARYRHGHIGGTFLDRLR
jgi:hypothetical protein